MAFLFPECEFCANHARNHAECEECNEGDCFEPIEEQRHRKSKNKELKLSNGTTIKFVHDRGEQLRGLHSDIINSILKDYP